MFLLSIALLATILVCSTAVPTKLQVTGGVNATIEDFPYLIILASASRGYFCGGTLISSNWALSTGYCAYVANMTPEPVYVFSNSSHFNDSTSVITPLKEITPHPEYNTVTYMYDISLVEFSSAIECTNCKPIPMSPKPGVNLGDTVTISGWGFIRGTDGVVIRPEVLQSGQVSLVDQKQCSSNYSLTIMDTSFCAYYRNGKEFRSACIGDEGTAAVFDGKVVGVFSYGICGIPGYPGMFADVTKFLDWIEEISGIKPE